MSIKCNEREVLVKKIKPYIILPTENGKVKGTIKIGARVNYLQNHKRMYLRHNFRKVNIDTGTIM